ncbi:MAG: hypothetical protein IKO56_01075, partial [Alphaproteobacteria bacterium]|nr:hypothetical protein [Alphaproteobacteria bacterium]
MRKILSLILGLLWAVPVWGACQNLYNESAVTDGYFYNADFEWTENASTYTTDFMNVAQGTYVLSVNKKTNLSSPVNVRVNLFDANKVIKSQLVFSIDNGTTDLDIEISIPVDVSYVRASSNPTFVTFESFLPINCVNSCRNLADMTEQNIMVGKYVSAEGIISDSEYNFTYMTFIPVKPNTTYTLSFSSPLYFASVSEYSTASDGGFITRQTKYSTSTTEPFDLTDFTFTTGATTNYIRWGSNMYKSRAITLNDVLSLNYMFEEGDT